MLKAIGVPGGDLWVESRAALGRGGATLGWGRLLSGHYAGLTVGWGSARLTHVALGTGDKLGLIGHLSGVKLIIGVDWPLTKTLILSLVRLSWNRPRKPRKGLLVTIIGLGRVLEVRKLCKINEIVMIY